LDVLRSKHRFRSRLDVLQVLDALEDSLALATIEQNWKNRVGRQTELRHKFSAPDLTVRQEGYFQIINVEGHEITIGSMATDEQIGAEIARIRPTQQKNPSMSITGLKSGAFKAMLEEMKSEIGNLQSQGVADVKAATVEAATEIQTTVNNVKAKLKSEVADALQEFSEFTNGGPE
jgi:hypothetical protein